MPFLPPFPPYLAQHSGGMAYHSYSDDERMAFTEHINNSLAADPVSGGVWLNTVEQENYWA